jgi:DNA polymerase-3 subunit delta'
MDSRESMVGSKNDFYPWLSPIIDKFMAVKYEKKLAHAWVFYGQLGVGKSALVQELSKKILSPDDLAKQQWIEANTHPDFRIVAPNDKGNIAIDAIREAIEFLANTPVAGASKILCLLQADKMNVAAQSALLKTLEEPLGHAYLLLTAENTSQLLPTLMSRCSKQAVPLPNSTELDEWLNALNLNASPENLVLAKTLANYSPGLTLSLLSELSQINQQASPEAVKKSLPLLLYLLSVIAGHWGNSPGLSLWVENKLGLTLPSYVFSPCSQTDRQRKIEFYRYVCRLREKVQSFSGINTGLLLHSIEHFDLSSKRIVW